MDPPDQPTPLSDRPTDIRAVLALANPRSVELSGNGRRVLRAAHDLAGGQAGRPVMRSATLPLCGLSEEQVADAWGELVAAELLTRVDRHVYRFTDAGLRSCNETQPEPADDRG